MNLEHTHEGLLVIYKAFYLDVTRGRMNRAPNEARAHLRTFASLACEPLHYPRRPCRSSNSISSLFLTAFVLQLNFYQTVKKITLMRG